MLSLQMREQQAKRAAEHSDEVTYFNQEQAQLREWERQEEVRRKLQHDIVERIKAERQMQLDEKKERIENVRAQAASLPCSACVIYVLM